MRIARPARGSVTRLVTGLAAGSLCLGVAVQAEASAPEASTPTSSTASSSARPAAAKAVAGRQPVAPPGKVALTWAALYMADDHIYTAGQATKLAKRFDIVSAMPSALADHSASMRVTNPHLTLLSYANATMLRKSETRGFPERSFAHRANGRRIGVPAFSGYLMESTDPTWRRAAAQQCNDRVALGGFDGCLIDMLGLGVFNKGYITASPVNPKNGRKYTQKQYRNRMIKMAAYYRTQNPSLIHIGNAAQNSYRYWHDKTTSRPLVASMPSAEMEDFLRGSRDAARDFPTLAQWKDNVRIVADFEKRGQTGLFITKIWQRTPKTNVKRWQKYAMATFLMAANGKSYFAFSKSRTKAGAMQTNLPYRLPAGIGLPRGAMVKLGNGAYVRRFTEGIAVVNPRGKAVRVRLGATLTSLDGRRVSSVKLPAHGGEILLTPTGLRRSR